MISLFAVYCCNCNFYNIVLESKSFTTEKGIDSRAVNKCHDFSDPCLFSELFLNRIFHPAQNQHIKDARLSHENTQRCLQPADSYLELTVRQKSCSDERHGVKR